MKCTIEDLYDLSHTKAADYLKQFKYPWEALEGIKELIIRILKRKITLILILYQISNAMQVVRNLAKRKPFLTSR